MDAGKLIQDILQAGERAKSAIWESLIQLLQ